MDAKWLKSLCKDCRKLLKGKDSRLKSGERLGGEKLFS